MRGKKRRLLALALLLALLTGCGAAPAESPQEKGASAAESGAAQAADEETAQSEAPADDGEEPEDDVAGRDKTVRVTITIEGDAVTAAGYGIRAVLDDPAAQAYQAALEQRQNEVVAAIEAATGHTLEVRQRFTLSVNAISADVPYGDLETIRGVAGVTDIAEETVHHPTGSTGAAIQ